MAFVVDQEGGVIGGLGSCYKVSFYSWLDGQLGETGVSLKLNAYTGAGGDFLGDVLLAIGGIVWPLYRDTQSTTTRTLGMKMSRLGVSPSPLPGICTDTTNGAVASPSLPTAITPLVKLTTTMAGRPYRGRMYVPFPPLNAADTDQQVTAAYQALLVTWGNAFLSGISVSAGTSTYDFLPVIYHRKAAAGGVPAANTFDIVTDWNVEAAFATQHRRGAFGRTNGEFIS